MSADILAALKRIEAKLDAVLAARQQAERSAPGKAVAPDTELDGQYGDPEIRFNPRDWTGTSHKNRHYSQAEPEFLDILANTLEFFAEKNAATDPKKAGYERRDAARARGWARRLRAGWKPAAGGDSRDYDFGGSEREPGDDF